MEGFTPPIPLVGYFHGDERSKGLPLAFQAGVDTGFAARQQVVGIS